MTISLKSTVEHAARKLQLTDEQIAQFLDAFTEVIEDDAERETGTPQPRITCEAERRDISEQSWGG